MSQHFVVDMPRGGDGIKCPVPGCPLKAQYNQPSRMRHHFTFAHMEHTIFIPQQGEVPRCQVCGHTGRTADQASHRASATCRDARERYRRYLHHIAEEDSRGVEFTVGGEKFNRVSEFKYLGRVVSEDDDDSPAIETNLKKARMKWAMFKRLQTREKASRRVMGSFYKAIVQSVLLYGSETWVISAANMRKLAAFHHGCARFISNCWKTVFDSVALRPSSRQKSLL